MQTLDIKDYFERYGPMVYRRCRFILKNEADAQDVLQEVFVQLLRRSGELHQRGPSSLLYTMATNLSLNQLRSRRRDPGGFAEGELEQVPGYGQHEQQTLNQMLLDKVFAREDSSTRLMAVLHWVDGMTLEETAAAAGLSVSGVRKRLRTLRAKASWLKDSDHE